MKFSGELKFPEIDHPGVPVSFVIEGSQAELVVEGESLGRWSLYDVHARRLVANAFQIDLDGTEVTFVADDPIDFAYRGVEHMAETWATLKSKRIATRSIAVRKSRKGTNPGRIEDMKSAMVSNLESQPATRGIAGEEAMPDNGVEPGSEVAAAHPSPSQPTPTPDAPSAVEQGDQSEEWARLEEARQRLAEERARFEEERRIAEQREADRVEAYRLEMKRLEAEREMLRQQADQAGLDEVVGPDGLEDETDVAAGESGLDEEEPAAAAGEGAGDAWFAPAEEPEEEEAEKPEEEETEERGLSGPGVLDLKDLEETDVPSPEAPAPVGPATKPPPVTEEPEPAMAGAAKDRSGLMGAVRAAFKSGPRDHQHRYIEAPGGIGITRYVCEECGYVSISV